MRKFASLRALVRWNLHGGAGLAVIESAIWHCLAGKMFPSGVASDVADRAIADAKIFCYVQMFFALFQSFDNFEHLAFVEFCMRMLRSFFSCASTENANCVQRVALHSGVFEILEAIVSRIAVFVVHHFAGFWRAGEGMHHQSMNGFRFLPTSWAGQIHAEMA